MPDSVTPPRQPRILVDHPAVLRAEGREDIACHVVDLSHDGFRVRTERPVPVGGNYQLHCGREILPVDVRWATTEEAGGLFLTPSSPTAAVT